MATKVGAFKKDGTVQCVKLVEESSIEMFNGTVDSNVITLNNGMKITFTYGPSDTPAGYTQTGSYLSFKDNTYGTPFLRLDINNTSTDKRVLASITNEEAWNSSEDLSIGMISGSIGAAVPSAPCKWVIEYKGQTDTYSISSRGPIITNAVGGNTLITSVNRTPTVRMGKDGTLKCKELIEETAVEDSSRLSMSQKTDALTLPYFNYDIRFINPGGQSLTIPSSYSELGYVTLLDSSGTQLNFSRSYSGGNNWTSSKNPSWTSGTVSIVRFTVSGTIKDSAPQIAFVDNGTKQTQSARTIFFTKGSDGYYSNTSTPVTFNYDWLLKTPTVRVYKDGTIKCREVEEATLTPKIGNGDWFEMTRSSASSGTFNFYGGQWTMTVEGPNGGSPTLFQTVSTIYAQVPLLPSGQPDSTIQWVGPPPYTTYYPSIYDEANYNRDGAINVNRIVVLSSTSMEGYKITINTGQNTAVYEWHLFTGTSNAFEPAGEQQWELTESDRFTYSWPGSTIVKATNTFITSDNKNFLTNTGDQFMVK